MSTFWFILVPVVSLFVVAAVQGIYDQWKLTRQKQTVSTGILTEQFLPEPKARPKFTVI